MTPVYQKVIDQGRGDCWRTCMASILELQPEEIPNFVGDEFDGGENCHQAARKWLGDRGLFLLDVNLKDRGFYTVVDWYLLRGAYFIASVPSQKFQGGWHSVVASLIRIDGGTKLAVVHDPNKLNEPYGDIYNAVRRLQFIVPFNPKINLIHAK